MKSPLFRAGQFIVLPEGHAFLSQPQIIPGRLYTLQYHIWTGTEWYVTLTEYGALVALKESAFRPATKHEQSLPF